MPDVEKPAAQAASGAKAAPAKQEADVRPASPAASPKAGEPSRGPFRHAGKACAVRTCRLRQAGSGTSKARCRPKAECRICAKAPVPAAPVERPAPQAVPHLALASRSASTAPSRIRSRLSPTIKAVLAAVLLPTLLSLLYFGLWASPMYIAEARFAVRGAENSGAAGGLAALLLPSGASVGADAHIVAEYIQSPDIMEAIDGELHIFRHFSSREYDLISRLAADATRDERLSYWNWAVKPSFDPETGVIALSVRAYDPSTAKKLAEAVLTKSEALVNAMSRRAQDDAIALAMSEVKRRNNG